MLSEQLKVLRVEPAEPDNLVQLDALLPEGAATTPGSFLTLDAPSEPTALATAMPSGTATPENADEADTAQETPNEVLNELLGELDQYGLLDGTTVLTMQNMTELSFLYQGRVSVQLGTANNLDYKIRFAAWQAVTAVRWMFRTSRRTAPFSRAFCRRKTLWPPRSRPRNPRQRIPRMLPPMQRQMVQT